MSPTQRTLALLRKTWPLVAITEHWCPFSRRRKDLFGFVDCLAIRHDDMLAVQTTSGTNVSARLEKIQMSPNTVYWLSNPACRLVIHGWALRGPRGKRKVWTCRQVEVVLNETGFPVIKEDNGPLENIP